MLEGDEGQRRSLFQGNVVSEQCAVCTVSVCGAPGELCGTLSVQCAVCSDDAYDPVGQSERLGLAQTGHSSDTKVTHMLPAIFLD